METHDLTAGLLSNVAKQIQDQAREASRTRSSVLNDQHSLSVLESLVSYERLRRRKQERISKDRVNTRISPSSRTVTADRESSAVLELGTSLRRVQQTQVKIPYAAKASIDAADHGSLTWLERCTFKHAAASENTMSRCFKAADRVSVKPSSSGNHKQEESEPQLRTKITHMASSPALTMKLAAEELDRTRKRFDVFLAQLAGGREVREHVDVLVNSLMSERLLEQEDHVRPVCVDLVEVSHDNQQEDGNNFEHQSGSPTTSVLHDELAEASVLPLSGQSPERLQRRFAVRRDGSLPCGEVELSEDEKSVWTVCMLSCAEKERENKRKDRMNDKTSYAAGSVKEISTSAHNGSKLGDDEEWVMVH